MKVHKLEGQLLDFWVAKSAGFSISVKNVSDAGELADAPGAQSGLAYHPSSDWAQGGAILSKEWVEVEDILHDWFGPDWPRSAAFQAQPLAWFMRAYVASRFGDEVEDLDSRYVAALHRLLNRIWTTFKGGHGGGGPAPTSRH